jgi:O-antigen ligase
LLVTAVLALPIGLVGLSLIYRFRAFNVLLVLIACIFLPIGFQARGSYVVLSLIFAAAFLGLWFMRMLVAEREFKFIPSPHNWPILGFSLVVIISTVWSNVFRDVVIITPPSMVFVQGASAVVMLCLVGVFLMVDNYFAEIKWLKAVVGILLAGGFFGLVNEFVMQTLPVQNRGTFTMWVMAVTYSLVLFHKGLSWPQRLGAFALMLGWAYWSFGLRITWLASWLPAMVALLTLSFMRSRQLLLALILGALLWAALNRSFIEQTLNAETDESGHTRVEAWQMNWTVTREHLLFGTGPGGYAVYYMTYFPTNAMATHNNYIDVISQLGLPGIIFYVWFFLSVAWQGFNLCRRLKGRGDFYEALANAAFAGTLGCIVINAFGDWLIPFAYTQGIAGFDYAAYNWLLMASIPVLDRLTRPAPDATALAHAAA